MSNDMSNEEAIKYFETQFPKGLYMSGLSERQKAYLKAIEALENQEKYRVHDLQKNPGDLPPIGTSVLIYDNNGFNNVMFYKGKLEEYGNADVWVDWNEYIQLNITAWKYI